MTKRINAGRTPREQRKRSRRRPPRWSYAPARHSLIRVLHLLGRSSSSSVSRSLDRRKPSTAGSVRCPAPACSPANDRVKHRLMTGLSQVAEIGTPFSDCGAAFTRRPSKVGLTIRVEPAGRHEPRAACLYSVVQRDPNHDAVIRIGSLAPRWGTILSSAVMPCDTAGSHQLGSSRR